jgi:hypothetical protein
MASAIVVLRRGSKPAIQVQADLSLAVAPMTRVESRVGEVPQALYLLDGSRHSSNVPAESATYSGALFALGRLGAIHGPGKSGDERYLFTIDRLSGVFQPEDVEGFAHAALVGIAHMTGRPELVTDEVLGEWELESCTVQA